MQRLAISAVTFAAAALLATAPAHATVYDTLDAADWTVSSASGGSTTSLSPATGPSNSLTFTYTNNGGYGQDVPSNDTYTIEATAPTTETITLDWDSSGFYAYAGVIADLSAFSAGDTQQLYDHGPVNCCTTPSDGFSYSGSVTLDLVAGQTYGFTVFGSNEDSDTLISGTLTISEPASAVPEPQAVFLLGSSLLGLIVLRRRSA